ncbi:hypothetical protein ABW20_dc0103234 [Dactylellina cionopaga]|nr:hypothetical protein ABW20_dc0103234 [Dactylellina cionopaga]
MAPSEYGDCLEYPGHADYDYDYTTGYEEDGYDWGAETDTRWQEHYSHPMYHMDYATPFSPDSDGISPPPNTLNNRVYHTIS